MSHLWKARPHPLYFASSFLVASLLLLLAATAFFVPEGSVFGWFLAATSAAVLVRPIYRILSASYIMTDETLIQRTGLIARRTSEVELRDVRSIQVHQGLLERALGLGSVLISTSGQSGVEIVLQGVARPTAIATLVREARAPLGETPA